ncbi:MAG: bifunctional phosphoglucose/phosphomannose isomerase [Candidatus Marinimicrobia bacterium]|nr:bifunctional phosphoglucose/phosphomannose isomerase [Candidatus Neomarinimicrobiota bacterium]
MKDLIKKIEEIDSQDMQSQISSIYLQVEDSLKISESFFRKNKKYTKILKKIDNVLIIGMGGSAIGAEFASKCFKNEYDKPIHILRDYDLPAWVNKKTFVIVSSYSGNTEETLSAYKSCLKIGCNSIAISTCGNLTKIANRNEIDVIQIPTGFQPRAAIGYSLSLILLIFEQLGLISNIENRLRAMLKVNSVDTNKENALVVSQKLYKKFPVIYSSGGINEVLAIRLKGQLAENSKILSYNSTFPEHNHNEIEGWNKLENITTNFVIVWINDEDDRIEIKKRMKIVSKIVSLHTNNQIHLHSENNEMINRVFEMINFIDWISYFLALKNDVNPSPVKNIEELKILIRK